MDIIRPELLIRTALVAGGLLTGFGLGVLLFLVRRRKGAERIEQELGQVEREYRNLVRTAKRLRVESETFSKFMVFLPDFVRQINQDLTPGNVARILAGVVQQMFEADQAMVFLTERGGKSLSLAAGVGIPENMKTGYRVRVGEGRIGWVGEHQVAMTREDFQAQSRVGQLPITGDPAGMKVDLAAPIVHRDRIQGALAVGGIGLHSKGEKAMIKMAADLGSIALHNAALFRQLEQAANHDGLTSLANKQFFMKQIGIQINEAEKAGRPLAVFIFDIDHFKSYNDQNGHLAGDEVLKQLSRLLRETLREDDLAARYGGEEFIVALPDTDREGALVVAETLRRTVEDFSFPNQSNQPSGNLTISGGLAMFPVDGRTSTELIGNADRALYVAKAQGRNQVVLFKAPNFGGGRIDDLFEGLGG